MSRIVVLGMFGRLPFGGQTWLYLNWLRGLQGLGHDVWYVEDDTVWPYDPVANTVTDDCSYAVGHIGRCMERIGLADRWAYRLADRQGAVWGMGEAELDGLYRSCDALFNIVGATDLRDCHMEAPLRVYVETDPVTAELRLDQQDGHTADAFAHHHVIATYGENYGSADCGVPLCGVEFVKTRQPIALDLWEEGWAAEARDFTTLGNYRQEGSDIEWRGDVYFWSKHHEWEKIIDLPRRSGQSFLLAVNASDDDTTRLERHGWKVRSPFEMSLDVFGAYVKFIRSSRAELTVAKDQNVRLRSGWFSERDACYLASGKPVVAQDTGYSNVLPTGEGLLPFLGLEEAVEAVESVNADYRRHCSAARAIAVEYFDAVKVAGRLCDRIGLQ